MNTAKRLSIILVIVFFGLVFSNRTIGFIWNRRNDVTVEKVNYDELRENCQKYIQAEIDYCYESNTFFDTVTINGWAYYDENEDDNKKKISVILQSNDNCYKISTELYSREGSMKGFGVEFSTLGIPKGIYGVVLCCNDGGKGYGLHITKYFIQVNSDGASFWEYEGKEIQDDIGIKEIKMDYSFLCDTDICIENNKMELWGWGLIAGESATEQEIIVVLQNGDVKEKMYTTMKVNRGDVAEVFGNSDYEMSGFYTTISNVNISEKNWCIRLYIKEGESYFQSPNYYIYNDTLKRFEQRSLERTVK